MRCSLLDYGMYFYPEKDNLALDKPCCTFHTDSSNKNLGKLNKISLMDLPKTFDNSIRKLAIQSLEEGKKYPGCSTCWKHEDSNYPSMRTRTNEIGMTGPKGKLKYLELNTGNTCNIQCVMCNPNDSLKTKEYIPIRKKYFQSENKKWDNSLYARGLQKKHIDDIDFDIFSDLEILKSTGGETFYSKQYWYFLEKLIEKGYAKNINLINVTNNTIALDDDKLRIFNCFNKIKIFSSVDGIGNLCESVRAGSIWNDVENNVKHLIELSKQQPDKFKHTEPHSVVQFANVLQLDEIVDWWESIALDDFKGKQYFRILDDPVYYDIRNLSDDIKDLVIDKYKNSNKLAHVSNYIKNSKADEKYHNSDIGLNIFRESCKINKTDPNSSQTYRILANGI